MSTTYRNRIFCVTDNRWEFTYVEALPTVCPVNAAHTVDLNSVTRVFIRVTNPPFKIDATVAPGAADDTTAGWMVGSAWVDVNTNKAYCCVDDTAAAAMWTEITTGTNTPAQVDAHIADGTIHFTEASIDHGNVAGLADDDHTQYALLAGRAGGQDLIGGTAASNVLSLESTSNATKGTIDLKDPTRVDDLDTLTATTMLIGKSTATKVEIADAGVATEVQGNLDALSGLDVTGNITVTGTVDGVDVATLDSDYTSHAADATIHFTEASIEHGSIAGLADDDHSQYALLAGRAGGQDLIGGTAASNVLSLESTSNATKGTIDLKDPTRVDDLDTLTATTMLIGKSTATKVELADTGVVTEVQGNLDALEGLDVTGNITVTGTVDGRDVATDGSTLDNHVAATAAHGATGAVVGTTDAQTLTNKTINTASNTLTIDAGDVTTGTLPVARGGTGATTLTQDGWLIGNGTGAFTAIKNNMNASVAPAAATDDVTLGYAVGSRWFDTTADKEYVCLDNTDGAAVWTETTGAGTGDVTAASNIAANAIVTGDDGVKGVKASGWTIDANNVMGSGIDYAGYILDVHNTRTPSGGNGFRIMAGESLGDIAFHVADTDDTFQIMEMEADQGYITCGKTYAQTLTDNGVVYGIDIQHSGNAKDFNTQNGVYRVGGKATALMTEFQNASSDDVSSTTSTTFVQKLKMTTGSLPSGVYRIAWHYETKSDNASGGEIQVQLNDTTTIGSSNGPDSSTPGYLGGGNIYYTGTISGVQDIDIDYRALAGTMYIKEARIEIWRMS